MSGQYSEGLAAAATATSGGASVVSGLPTDGSPLAAGSNATVTLGLASVANVGLGNAGTVTLGLQTSGTGTSGLAAASIGPDVNGSAINFDPTQAYAWTIARLTDGGTIQGFSADKFNLNLLAANGAGGFLNSLAGGTISIEQAGADLNLVFTPVPEPAGLAFLAATAAGAWVLLRRRRAAAPAG